MHKSVATINSPEFINLQPLEINPLMSSCEIKVLYVGENRNHSFITKEVALDMAKTLRGAPIVGYFKEDKQDFADHGDRVTIDDQGIHFECMTKPYGFVSPDAKVWFQEFEDTDDFGNTVVREYLMTTGYLWAGQFEECKTALEQGRPQSMELDEDTLQGHWSTNNKTGMDFFIINDATFSKLCILGDDVEPCFEGASVTASEVSKTFSLDNDFKATLYNMMQDLKNFALKEGDKQMQDLENPTFEVEENPSTEPETSFEKKEEEKTSEKPEEKEVDKEEDLSEDKEDEEKKKNFVKEEEKEEEKSDSESDTEKEDSEEDKKEEEKKPSTKSALEEAEKKYSVLEARYTELQTKYSELENRCAELAKFKENADMAKKEQLVNSFYMLSDEDKKDVVAHISEYSYDEIEAKLSVICVRKRVNFDLEDTSKSDNKVEETPIVTFNLENTENTAPAWVTALRNARAKNV